MKQIHWAIIGSGVISQSHLDAVAALPDATIYAVCDVDAARAEKKRAEFGAQKVYTDYHALLADPAVDVVSICTPSGMHAEMAIAAARAGKHIFCEKPMDVTAEKMSAMIDAIERAGVKCGCVFQRRTYPEARAVHDFIAQHDLGPHLFGESRQQHAVRLGDLAASQPGTRSDEFGAGRDDGDPGGARDRDGADAGCRDRAEPRRVQSTTGADDELARVAHGGLPRRDGALRRVEDKLGRVAVPRQSGGGCAI